MRTFYIMAVVAAVGIVIVLFLVLGSNTENTPPGSSTNTTAAVEGSTPDCDKLTGSERTRCMEQRKQPENK